LEKEGRIEGRKKGGRGRSNTHPFYLTLNDRWIARS
jgi:hypothetical protein